MEHSIITDCTRENKRSVEFTGETEYFQGLVETYFSGLLQTHWREVAGGGRYRLWPWNSKANWFQGKLTPWPWLVHSTVWSSDLWPRSWSCLKLQAKVVCLLLSRSSVRAGITWNCWQHNVVNGWDSYTRSFELMVCKKIGFRLGKKITKKEVMTVLWCSWVISEFFLL